jgi:hypothetical protein
MPDRRGGSVIVFRFQGGLRDGQALRSDEPEAAKEAQALWELTWNGTVGRRFDVAAPNAPTVHRYQVSSKYESGGEIHVTCALVGNR